MTTALIGFFFAVLSLSSSPKNVVRVALDPLLQNFLDQRMSIKHMLMQLKLFYFNNEVYICYYKTYQRTVLA